MNLDEYKEAMEYFKLGQSRTDYSRALQQYRTQFIAEWFNVFFIAVILICIGVRVLFYLKKRKTAIEGADVQIGYGTKLFSSLKHPQRDMMAFVKETRGAFWVAPAVALLWFFQKIFAYQCTGFVFNENDPSNGYTSFVPYVDRRFCGVYCFQLVNFHHAWVFRKILRNFNRYGTGTYAVYCG